MITISFYDVECPFLIDDSIISQAVKYIEEKDFENEICLNFSNCLVSYQLSTIFDSVINKLKKKTDKKRLIYYMILIRHTQTNF